MASARDVQILEYGPVNCNVAKALNHRSAEPGAKDFEDSLIKAGAVILAALEHIEAMTQKDTLR